MNTVRYASWMQASGFRVTVFAVAQSPLASAAENARLRVVCVRRNRKYADFAAVHRMAGIFREEGIQIIWFRDTRDMDLLSWVRRISGSRIRLIYHQAMQLGVDKRDLLHTFRFAALDAWVATLHVLAEQVKKMTRIPASRIHVVPLGVDEAELRKGCDGSLRSELGIADDVFLAAVVGRIDPLKDQLCAVKALHLIRDRHPGAHLLIAGDQTRHEGDDYAVNLKRYIRQMDLQDRVHYLPHSSAVGRIYEAIQALLMTSKGETFGMVTIEAMCFGLPVIGTDSSGTPEILDQGRAGLLFEPGNADALASAWSELIRDPETARQTGQQARIRYEKEYSRSSSVEGMARLIRELTGS